MEDQVCTQLDNAGISYRYEEAVIRYKQPARFRRYTPDIILPNGIIIETKGRFVTADRQKHLWIQHKHPELDIRFVFSYSRSRISKQSKTTYALWCETHGFQYADKFIPEAWLKEPPNRQSLTALERWWK